MEDPAAASRIDIVVCVHNAAPSVARCLASLEAHFPPAGRLVVVDDGSDETTRDLLAQWQRRLDRIDVLRNPFAQGYTCAANRGLRASTGDVVILLNSDTVVTSGWADRIGEVFASDPTFGIVGPLSNAASWQSFPGTRSEDGTWLVNDLPLGVDLEELAELVSDRSGPFPRLPVINGFCFAVHRRVIDRIGLLDEEAFPLGYGEETDYCLRASAAGFSMGVADHAFVYHEKSSSFGHERRLRLSQVGWEALKAKHGSALLARVMDDAGSDTVLPARRAQIRERVRSIQRSRQAASAQPVAAIPVEPGAYQSFLREVRQLVVTPRRPACKARVFVLASELDRAADVRRTVQSVEALNGVKCTVVGPANVLAETRDTAANLAECPEGAFLAQLSAQVEQSIEDAVMIVPAGSVVHPACLGALARLVQSSDGCVACTFDEDVIGQEGSRSLPALKPAFSPTLLAESGYVGWAAWLRRDIVLRLGLDSALPALCVSALLLDAWKEGFEIAHAEVPGVSMAGSLFNVPTRAQVRQLRDRLPGPGLAQAGDRTVASVVVPFRGKPDLLRCCIGSMLAITQGLRYEILLVDNASNDAEMESLLVELSRDARVRVLRYPGAFNYSAINNFAAAAARGDVLVFLNNDTEVLHPEWLAELCGQACMQNIGAVGGFLFFPDGTVQHAGVVIGFRGLAGHVFSGMQEHELPVAWTRFRREATAVTGACMAVLRSRFEEVGGFDERFEVTASDVELCLRLECAGYRSVFTPHARLVHHERKTRRPMPVRAIDLELSLRHYEPHLSEGDPLLNRWYSRKGPGLSLSTGSGLETRRFVGEAKGRLDAIRRERERRESAVRKLSGGLAVRRKLQGDAEVTVYDAATSDMAANAELLRNAPTALPLRTATWFVPYFDLLIRGGIYTIFRIADYLSRTRGTRHAVVIYGACKRTSREIREEIASAFPLLQFQLLLASSPEDVDKIPASDAGICTLWNSAYYLLRYNKCRAKFYLVQDHEPIFQAAGSVAALVEQTYRFGFRGIANTPGVAARYQSYGGEAMSFVPAVDRTIFHPPATAPSGRRPTKVVFYGRPGNARNGFRLGIEALRIAKLAMGDALDVVSVGGAFDPAEFGVDGLIRNLGVLQSIGEVAELYRSADIGLVFMFTAHPSYQPFEYMASGCVVVSNYNECNLWFLRHRENALLCPPTVSAVAEAILELAQDEDLRYRLREEGLRSVGHLDWEHALEAIARFMQGGTAAE